MRSASIAIFALFVCIISGAGGCAKYEYDLVEPREMSRHVGRSVDAVVDIDPFTYRLRSVDNRLVMRVYNNTDESIELLGDKSTVVDPDGQSHPLRSQAIAPKSFIKLIFPPPRPQVYDSSGPTFGVGVGYGMRVDAIPGPPPDGLPDRRDFHTLYPLWEPYFRDEPRYISVVDESDTYYWNWKGVGESRVNLVYRRGEGEIRHAFVFRRVKM
jgi:hypothetical protein